MNAYEVVLCLQLEELPVNLASNALLNVNDIFSKTTNLLLFT